MFDDILFNKAEALIGAFFSGGASDALIADLEEALNVKLPVSYIQFLKRFGAGGLCGSYTNGIEKKEFSSTLEESMEYMNEYGLTQFYIVIAGIRTDDEEGFVYLDINRTVDGECPVMKLNLDTRISTELHENFYEYFNHKTKLLLDKKLKAIGGMK